MFSIASGTAIKVASASLALTIAGAAYVASTDVEARKDWSSLAPTEGRAATSFGGDEIGILDETGTVISAPAAIRVEAPRIELVDLDDAKLMVVELRRPEVNLPAISGHEESGSPVARLLAAAGLAARPGPITVEPPDIEEVNLSEGVILPVLREPELPLPPAVRR